MKPTKEKMVATLKAGKIRLWNRWRRATAYARVDLSYARLSKADLSHADLSYARLYKADLYKADLSDASLYKADLYNADLSGAELSGARLSGARLSYADLSYARLYNADLSGANLSNASLYKADLSHAKGICITGPMESSGRMVYWIYHDGCIMVQAGCFWGTTAELRDRIEAENEEGTHWDYLAYADIMERKWK